MEPRTIKFSGMDNSVVDLKIAKNTLVWVWTMGKCQSVWCRNHIYFILFNKKDEATLGYCHHGVGAHHRLRKGQRWVVVNKGKFIDVTEAEAHGQHSV